MRVTYWLPLMADGAAATQRTIRLTIGRRSEITTLVRAVNALPVSTRAPGSPPPTWLVSSGQHATLVFAARTGAAITVTNDPACGAVTITGAPPLIDPGLRFWKTVRTMAGLRCRCVPYALT